MRSGNNIIYKKNSVVLCTTASTSSFNLMLDLSIQNNGNFLSNVRASFPASLRVDYYVTDVLAPSTSNGSISLMPLGGTAPYTYAWSTGDTSATVSGLTAGNYSFTATDASSSTVTASVTVGYQVFWEDTAYVTTTGNSIAANSNKPTGWNAGGASKNYIAPGQDGYVSYVVTKASGEYFVFGLSSMDVDFTASTMPYAFYLNGNAVNVLINGTYPNYNPAAVALGDTLTVRRSGSNIQFLKNSTLINQFTTSQKGRMVIDVGMSTVNDVMGKIKTNIGLPYSTRANITDQMPSQPNSGNIALEVFSGQPPYTYVWSNGATTQNLSSLNAGSYAVTVTDSTGATTTGTHVVGYQVVWEDTVHVVTTGNSIIPSPTAPFVQSGAASKNYIAVGQDGYVQVILSKYATNTMIGLSAIDVDATTSSVAFGVNINGNSLYLSEGGQYYPLNYTTWPIYIGDTVTVRRRGGYIDYVLNGTTLMSTATTQKGRLLIDVSLSASTACIYRIKTNMGIPFSTRATVTDQVPTQPNSGAVALDVMSGQAPYAFSWSNGATTQSLTGVNAGKYTVTVTDASGATVTGTHEVGNQLLWENTVNVVTTSNSVSVNPNNTFVQSGASSKNYIAAGQDGYVSVVLTKKGTGLFGLSTGYFDATSKYVGFGLNFNGNGLSISQAGKNYPLNSTTWPIELGDTLMVKRHGTNMEYWLNSTLLMSTAMTQRGRMLVDVSLSGSGYAVSNIKTNLGVPFSTRSAITDQVPGQPNSGNIALEVLSGQSPYTYAWSNGATTQNLSSVNAGSYTVTVTDASGATTTDKHTVGDQITWQNVVGATTTPNGVNTTVTAWAGGASSKNYLAPNQDGYLQEVIRAQGGYVIGISEKDSNVNSNTIKYGIFLNGNTSFSLTELTSFVYSGTAIYPGDTVYVGRTGDSIFYKLNGNLLRKVFTSKAKPLLADLSFGTGYPTIDLIKTNFGSLADSSKLYWTGTQDSLWNNANNWSFLSGSGAPGKVPDSTSTVYFNQYRVRNCYLNTAATVNAVQMDSGVTVNLQSYALTVNHGYLQNKGTLNGGTGTLTVKDTLVLNGGTFNSAGTLNLYHDFTDTLNIFHHNNGTVVLNNNANVKVVDTLYSLNVPTNVSTSLLGNLTVSNVLTLGNAANILSNSYSVRMLSPSPSALVQSTGSYITESNSYFNSSIDGQVGTSTGTYSFPFATSTGSPVNINFQIINAGGSSAGNVQLATYENTTSQSSISYPASYLSQTTSTIQVPFPDYSIPRYWLVNQYGYTASSAIKGKLTLSYTLADLNNNSNVAESRLVAYRYNGSSWDKLSGTVNTNLHTFTLDSVNKLVNIIVLADSLNYLLPPVAPVQQSVCGNASQSFSFGPVAAGVHGDQIEWATNNSFSNSTVQSAPATITLTVNSGSTDTIWIRSKNSIIGSTSAAVTTMAKVNALPSASVAPNTISICNGSSTVLTATGGTSYQWGNGATSSVDTVSTAGTYSVVVTDSNGCSAIASAVVSNILTPSTPVFTSGDSIVVLGSSPCYQAVSNNSWRIVYFIDFDSVGFVTTTGCVPNIYGNFSVRATAYSLNYCDSQSAQINVVTDSMPSVTSTLPQHQCSNGDVTFVFEDTINYVSIVDYVDYSTDSTFASFSSYAPPGTFNLNVLNGDTATVYLRTRNQASGIVGPITSTYAYVLKNPRNQLIYPDAYQVCPNKQVSVFLGNSQKGVSYQLYDNGALSNSALGIDTLLLLNTVGIDTTSMFTVIATDTLTGCIDTFAQNTVVLVASKSDDPTFISVDSTLCVGGNSCYQAVANNSVKIIYAIDSGSAAIDTISGCVQNVGSSFRVKATAVSYQYCDSPSTYFRVHVIPLMPPVPVTPVMVCSDSSRKIELDSVFSAGCGGNMVQLSYDSTFVEIDTEYIPAYFEIDVDSTTPAYIWLRTFDSQTGLYSAAISIALPPTNTLVSPIVPAPKIACCGVGQYFTFDSIYVPSCGGNVLEFSFDSTFSTFGDSLSPAAIRFWVDSGQTKKFWVRTKDTLSGNMSLSVSSSATVLTAPEIPPTLSAQNFCSDSNHTFIFTNVTAGIGGNQIEWAGDSTFASSYVSASPADLIVSVDAGIDSIIWIRSRDSLSGKASSPIFAKASVNHLPTGFIYPLDTTINAGDSVTLHVTTDPSNTYRWLNLHSNSDSVTVHPVLQSNHYPALICNQNGCTITANSTVNANKTGANAGNGYVNYVSLISDNDINRNISTQNPVGYIPGNANVSNTGAATYSIPINCPVGTNHMEPKLSLEYSSQSGNGIMGWGWKLGGLSAITRVPHNIYNDGKVAPISITDNLFSLDGQRLIPTGINQFRTENESFSKINMHIYGSTTYFQVWTKDGYIKEYGSNFGSTITNASGEVLVWKLNKITDPNGSYIIYNYANNIVSKPNGIQGEADGQEFVLDEINYTGNANAGLYPYNKVKFNYAKRNDVNTVYLSNGPVTQGYLLDNITITGEGNQFAKYQMSYGKDDIYSYLNSITLNGADGSSLNSTIFQYAKQSVQTTLSKQLNQSFTTGDDILTDNNGNRWQLDNVDKNKYIAGDYNGDGYTDILYVDHYQSGLNLATVFGLYTWSPVTKNFVHQITTPFDVSTTDVSYNPKPSCFVSSDFDGDGSDDILTYSTSFDANGNAFLKDISIRYSRNGGTNLSTVQHIPPPRNKQLYSFIATPSFPDDQLYTVHQNYVFTGDFDGDKRSDIFSLFNNQSQGGCQMFLSHPAKGILNLPVEVDFSRIAPQWLQPYSNKAIFLFPNNMSIGDFDGDGKTDILLIFSPFEQQIPTTNPTTVPNSDQKYYYCIITIVEENSTKAIGKIIQFDQLSNQNINQPFSTFNTFVGDFNGDGKSDLLFVQKKWLFSNDTELKGIASIDGWQIAYSKGDELLFKDFNFKLDLGANILTDRSDDFIIGDYNGDGKSDILCHRIEEGTNFFDVYYSNGVNFIPKQMEYDPTGSEIFLNAFSIPGDYLGKSKTSIINIHPNKVVYNGIGTNFAELRLFSFNQNDDERTLKKVENGINQVHQFDYDRLTSYNTVTNSNAIYIRASSGTYPLNYLQPPMQVVAKVTTQDGAGGNNITSYKYTDAAFHRLGRGFLGFGKIESSNNVTGITNRSVFQIDPTFYVNTLLGTASYFNNQVFNSTVYFNQLVNLGNKRYFISLNEVWNHDALSSVDKVTGNYYDGYGNLFNTYTTIGAGSITASSATTNYFISNPSRPFPSLLTKSFVTRYRPGQPLVTKQTSFGYDNFGNVNLLTENQGDPEQISSEMVIDVYGNITAIKSGITLGFGYDSKGRFLTTKTNALSQITTSTFNSPINTMFGKPSSVTDIYNNTLQYEYDTWGKLIATTDPTGFVINTSYVWDIQNSGANPSLYYTYTQHPGRPDVKTWYDLFGREVKTEIEGFNGQGVMSGSNEYNARGKISKATKPSYQNENQFTTSYTYDINNAYNRLIGTANPFGSTSTAYAYNPDGSMVVTETDRASVARSKTIDASGAIISSTDQGGTLNYTYDAYGNQTDVQMGTNTLVHNDYDHIGNVKVSNELNAGISTYSYDYSLRGLLKQKTDAKGNTYDYHYDNVGRITLKELKHKESTTYTYYTAGNGLNNIQTITYNNLEKNFVENKFFDYDLYNRVVQSTETVDGYSMTKYYDYDNYDNVTAERFSTGLHISNTYDANGYLLTTSDAAAPTKLLYQANAMNSYGQATSYTLGNGKTSHVYYNYGIPYDFETDNIQSLYYNIDYRNGNVTNRNDFIKNKNESFEYDALERLTKAQVLGLSPMNFVYDNNGNINSKTDAGTFTYHTHKIHAVTGINNPSQVVSDKEQDISYTHFNQPELITENGNTLEYHYGSLDERRHAIINMGGRRTDRYYGDGFERTVAAPVLPAGGNGPSFGGYDQTVHYINDAVMVVVQTNGNTTSTTHYYTYTDNLGSIVTVTDENANVVAEQNFDAWGRKRNPATWDYANLPTPPTWLYRGYTGHEHLPQHGLINMNGRMYDPLLGRMLSPDILLHDPLLSQSYNRYSYCLNNPLKYTDPSGYDFYTDDGQYIKDGWCPLCDNQLQVVTINGNNQETNTAVAASIGGSDNQIQLPLEPVDNTSPRTTELGTEAMLSENTFAIPRNESWLFESARSFQTLPQSSITLPPSEMQRAWRLANYGPFSNFIKAGAFAAGGEIVEGTLALGGELFVGAEVASHGVGVVGEAAKGGGSFFEGTYYTEKVLGQMKISRFHAFPESVKAFEQSGVISEIKGGDEITRQMLKIPGEYGDKKGFFEFIKEADGSINHRFFNPNP